MDNLSLLKEIQELRLQRMLEEQRRGNHSLVLLQQQQDMERTLAQQFASEGLRNQALGNNTLQMNTDNPIDIECRNIIALQEELKKQENRKRLEQILRAKMQEESILNQLRNQNNFQNNAAEQLLSRFAELNKTLSRQEAVVANQGYAQPQHNVNFSADLAETFRASMMNNNSNNNSNNVQEAIMNLLSQKTPIHQPHPENIGMNQQLNLQDPNILAILSNLGMSGNNSVQNSNIQNLQEQIQNKLKQPIVPEQDVLKRKLIETQGLNLPLDNQLIKNLLSQNRDVRKVSEHQVSKESERQVPKKSPKEPSIRYFNNGNEVDKNGQEISHLPSKKRKLSHQSDSSSDNQKQEQLSKSVQMRHGPPKKRNLGMQLSSERSQLSQSTYASSNSDSNGSDGNDSSKTPEEKFPVEKEEDRVDAANVLLDLMKRN